MPADGAMSAHPAGWHWGKLDPIVIEAVRTPSGTWVSPEAQQMQRGLENQARAMPSPRRKDQAKQQQARAKVRAK
jgi:hypothetical protein